MTAGRHVPPSPSNEPVLGYAPGSPERATIEATLRDLSGMDLDAPCVIGGTEVRTAQTFEVRSPHRHDNLLATAHAADPSDVQTAIKAANEASHDWAAMRWEDRAAIFLKAAELLSGPWRARLNAATMLGQSKTVLQAEIDSACELIDFLRFNVSFYADLLADQPNSSPGVWNRTEMRPLEGFVLAMTPFNFTAIAGNLPTAPALIGNTVLWKPSDKQAFAAQFFMQLLQEAGLPDGVINLVHGSGAMVSEVAMADASFAGLHFTGSEEVFRSLWARAGQNIDTYATFPRIVGETGGKDFVLAHPSARIDEVATALVRGAFEYQGQKCSAASRAYLPRSLWEGGLRDRLADQTASIAMGDVADLSNFIGAVIDRVAFNRLRDAQEQAAADPAIDVLVGGGADDTDGFFVDPTIVVTTDPRHDLMKRELFGPLLTTFVYDDADWDQTLDLVDGTARYALTGAVFATDRAAVATATSRLRQAAGNFYINDKPTGAVVGQQPFGGARASGTNDKAGSPLNLLRWSSMRTIKETFTPPTDHRYPHMG